MSRRSKQTARRKESAAAPTGPASARAEGRPGAGGPQESRAPKEERGLAGPPDRRAVVGICLFLAAIVWVVFGQTAGFGFINYDDRAYVYENPVVKAGLTWKGLIWAFKYGDIGHWHPLTWLSHEADCQLYGLWAGGHHLSNVALHAAAAVLLFLVWRAMTGAFWRSAFVAAVFAVHPLRAESVAWVAERKDVLSGLFFMLTLWAYLRYVEEKTRNIHGLHGLHGWKTLNPNPNLNPPLSGPSVVKSRSPALFYGLTLVFFALGLLAKNTLVTLPFLLLLLDWWPLRRIENLEFRIENGEIGEERGGGVPIWALVREKIPLFLLALGSCVATALVPETVPLGHQLGLWIRMENALAAYTIYLRQMVWPTGLANPYPYPPYGASFWQALLALVLLAGFAAWAYARRDKSPFLLVGWLWFVGMLIPMSGVVQISYYSHADRYTYLPEIGLAIAGTWAAWQWSAGWKHRRVIWGGFMGVVIAALMLCAHRQTGYWKDSETLWRRALAQTTGNTVAAYALGGLLQDQGRLEESVVYFGKVLEMNPRDYQAECDMGSVLMREGRTPQAIACFRRSLEIQPDYAKARCNLGDALLQQGETNEAVACFQRTLASKPDYAKADYDWGNVLFDQGHLYEAITHYQKALVSYPRLVEAEFNLGNALLAAGRFDEAVAHYKKVLELRPGDGGALNNLGTAYTRLGRVSEAMEAYRQALKLQPENVDALNNLAWALATGPQAAQRDGAAALAMAKKAVQATGEGNPLMLRTLAAAYAETGSFATAAGTARRALDLAKQQKNDALATTLQEDIKLYEAKTPVRDAPQ